MKNNVMYEGISNEGNTKLIVIPYLTIGQTIVNVLVEYYMADIVCKNPGQPAANGWHEYPTYRRIWDKKPYTSQVMPVEVFEKRFKDILLNEIV